MLSLLSYYQYAPWRMPTPTAPVWGYRVTQGLHVTTGIACIPLIFVKLWSVYPNFFRWPPFPSVKRTVERVSLALLISSSLLQLFTGFCNVLGWYPFRWDFIVVHYALAWVVIGSVLLHVGIKPPDINYGLRAKLPEADVLTEIRGTRTRLAQQCRRYAGTAHTRHLATRPAGRRRHRPRSGGHHRHRSGPDTAGTDRAAGPRQPSRGPQGLPVGKTAAEAQVGELPPDWQLEVAGPQPYALSLADLEELAVAEEQLPFAANEGWSATVHWRGCDCSTWCSGPAARRPRRFGSFRSNQGDRSTSRWSKASSCPKRCWPPISTESGSASTTAIHCG